MDAKKETRHFVRDRCNFNKKKRIKYITIGLVISVLTGFLLYNIAFAGGTNYHHTGAAKINVAGSEMQLRFEYAGGNDKLETDGEYRSLFKNKSRSVYVWADQYSSGGLQVGIEKNGGGHITKKDRIICKTSLDDDKGYSIVTFNISYIQPAHKYINRYQADDKSWRASGEVNDQSGGRFIIFSNGIANTNSGHAASNHWVTLTVQINLSNTGMLTGAGDGKFHWATKHVSFGQNTYNFTYKTNGGTITNLNESKNIGGNAVYTRACGGGIGRVPTVTKNGYYLEGWYYDDGRKLDSSNPNITLCQGDQWVTAKWVAYKHNVTYDLQGGKYDDDKRTELNGCKIIPNGVYHMKSGCGTNMYMHVAKLDDERHSGPATVIYSGADYIQTEWIFERYEHARAKMFDMPMPYNIIKNYTMPEAIIKDGPDKGKAKTKKIFISRTSVDEKTGKPMRSPWAIQIENGVSRPKNGGRSSVEIEPNSYQCRVRGYMRINDIDFLDFIDKAYTYMEEYRHIIAQDIVPRGEKILDEMQKRRGNTYNTVPPEEYIPESPGLVSSEQPEENFSKSSNAPVSTNSATQSNKRPQLYEVVAIIGELQGYEDYFLSNCLINNKEYLIYFYPQYITNALQEAIRLKKATNIYVYKKEKNILFYKLAAPKK